MELIEYEPQRRQPEPVRVHRVARQEDALAQLAQATAPPPPPQVVYAQPAPVYVNVVQNNNTSMMSPGFSPLVAAFLSFLIPGLGQMYKGQVLNGIAWFFAVIVGYICLIIPGLILHLCCIVGAASGRRY